MNSYNHYYVNVENEDEKLQTLRKLYKTTIATRPTSRSVIYVNNRHALDKVTDMMRFFKVITTFTANDIKATNMHEFQDCSSACVLITTESMATRLDLSHVTTIVNYDIPDFDLLQYVMRVQKMRLHSVVINLVTPDAQANIADIKRYFDVVMVELPTDGSLVITNKLDQSKN